jgi:hypothetical protein
LIQKLSCKNLLAITIVTVLCISIVSTQEALAVGLKVNVKLFHSNNGLTKVCVNSAYQNLGCRTITLSGLPNPYTPASFIFGENLVPVGGQFKACATNMVTNAYRCATGTNSPAKLPEYVSVVVPGNSKPNENWWGTCKSIEWGLLYPCSTYVKPDGTLTAEGKRAKDCISSGGLMAAVSLVGGLLPPDVIIAALEPASKLPLYDCDGIVNWQVLKGASGAAGFLKVLGIG